MASIKEAEERPKNLGNQGVRNQRVSGQREVAPGREWLGEGQF